MEKKLLSKIIILFLSLIPGTIGMLSKAKTWTYELKSVSSETSDAEKFWTNLEIERISRGVYALSGDLLIRLDIVEGDSNKIEAKSYRSAQGNSDYKILPFQMSSAHFFNILNTYYKDVLMDTIKDCSDLPVFEDKFQPPFEKKTYKLNKCQFSQDGLPNHLQEGYYKVLIIGTGDVDWHLEIVAEVTKDI